LKKIITNLLCFDLFYKQQQTLKLSNLIKMVDNHDFNLINKFSFNNSSNNLKPIVTKQFSRGDSSIGEGPGVHLSKLGEP